MREKWTDERLDDLAGRMDAGFDRVDADLRSINARFDEFSRHIDAKFDAKFDSLTRTLLQVGGALCAGMLGLIAAMASLIATQL